MKISIPAIWRHLIVLIILILAPVISFSQKSLDKLYPVENSEFKLTLRDGTILDCTKFIPQSTLKNNFPAVIFLHGFGGSKNEMLPFAENLAKYGYCAFTYSMRGQGNSTGYSNLISRTEMYDLIEVIKYVKGDQAVDTGKVCLTGSSQGGIISFMAACFGAGVSCIVADLSSPEFASSWIENGSVKMTLFWSLNYDSSIVRYSKIAMKFKKWILGDKKKNWNNLARYLPKDRDFAARVKDLKTPILISNSWQDKFFNANGILKSSASIFTPFKIYLGAVGGHGSDTTLSESVYHSSIIEKWIEYRLYGIENGIAGIDRFTYASSIEPVNYNHWSFNRFSSDIWPPSGTTSLRFYFHPFKKLASEINLSKTDTVSFLNDVNDGVKMLDVIKTGFTGSDFDSKFVKTYIFFETDVLNDDLVMAGSPAVNLVYSSNADICQYNFQIWEVSPDGQMNFVTRINFTDRYYHPNTSKQIYFYGQAHSHIFRKGSRIRVYVTNLDNGPYDSFLRTNPFVLPVLKRAKNIIYMSSGNSSYVELPVIR